MPQMAPLNWILLFTFFCLTFFIFNTLNYYCFFYFKNKKLTNNNNNNFKNKKIFNWKW